MLTPENYPLWQRVSVLVALLAIVFALFDLLQGTGFFLSLMPLILIPSFFAALFCPLLLAAATSMIGVFGYSFFYVPPYNELDVFAPSTYVSLLIYTGITLVTYAVNNSYQKSKKMLQAQGKFAQSLYHFSNMLFTVRDSHQLIVEAVEAIHRALLQDVHYLNRTDGLLQQAAASCANELPADVVTAVEQLATGEMRAIISKDGKTRDWFLCDIGSEERSLGVLVVSENELGEQRQLQRTQCSAFAETILSGLKTLELQAEVEQASVASQAEELRSALLSAISHDLKTPLASIIGSASSVVQFGDKFDSETINDLIATILEEATRLNAIVTDILDVTKLESGHLRLRYQPIELSDLVETAVENLEGQLKGYEILFDLQEPSPLVEIDIALVQRVLSNLLENARKFSDPGGRIHLSAGFRDDQTVYITVRDEGAGLSLAEQKRVFERFFQAKQKDRRMAGTGLGLSIAKAIVTAHHGTLSVASPGPGQGTAFTMDLPISPTELKVMKQQEETNAA